MSNFESKKMELHYGQVNLNIFVSPVQYYNAIYEYLNYHGLEDSEYSIASSSRCENVFHYIIDDLTYYEYKDKIQKAKVEYANLFKDDLYVISKQNEVTYYLLEKDNMISFILNGCTYVIVKSSSAYEYQLLRIIREFLYRKNEDMGKVFMHAAACEYKDNGFLILGNKAAGKTSLLNYFLNEGANYIANDRAFTKDSDAQIMIEGFPIPMRISYETVEKLNCKFEDVKYFRRQSENSDKLLITPFELSKIYQIRTVYSSPLNMVLVPEIVLQSDKLSIEPIGDDEYKNILIRNCYTPFDESRTQEWLYTCCTDINELKSNAENMINRLVEIPRYKLIYGTLCDPSFVIDKLYEEVVK